MDKRVLTAIILSMAVLFLYPYFISYIYPPQPKVASRAPVQAPATQGAPEAPKESAAARAQAPAETFKEELVNVETPLFKAAFSSIGGGVKSFELKKYMESLKNGSSTEDIAKTIGGRDSFKTQINVGGFTEDVALSPSRRSVFVADKETTELLFTGTTKGGLTVEKKYVFSGASYIIKTELKVVNTTANPFSGRADIVLFANTAGKDKTGYHTGPVVYTKNDLIRQSEKDAQKTGTDKLKWMGLEDKYFLAALIPATDAAVSWATDIASTTSSKATLQIPLNIAPGTQATYTYNTFMGPKEYDLLVMQKIGLEEAIEFGWFGFMAKPLLVVLNFFERYIGNYGIAIIIITVIIKVIFYPLTKHSLTSMREMQKIQPQLAAIKEKYKDNKEKLNREMMELYKRYKINPLGGCLPMVLQIPVFIALYEVLYVAIELRHAPLFLWIRDLSDKDPYYITPVIMGATMFIQQKMTPSTMDPAQAKVMLIMPVVFTFMFLNFPSGLVLYWLVNNILSIAQQYYIQRAPAKAT